MNKYLKGLKTDLNEAKKYYTKSLVKSEQQKFLERILLKTFNAKYLNKKLAIADIACGGGTLSYHISSLFKSSTFFLLDNNNEAIKLSKEININKTNFNYFVGSLYNSGFETNYFDITFCWQTLSWIEDAKKGLDELIRITKKGGFIFTSFLININHDVDLYIRAIDYTRASGNQEISYDYNTFSMLTINKWVKDKVERVDIFPFEPNIDLNYHGRGLGTYTIQTQNKRFQLSAGMLLNWGILIIKV